MSRVHGPSLATTLLIASLLLPVGGTAQAPPTAKECHAARFAGRDAADVALCYRKAAAEGDGDAETTLERLASQRHAAPAYLYELGNLRWRDRAVAEDLFRRAAEGFAAAGDEIGEMRARVSRKKHLGWLERQEEMDAELGRIGELAGRSRNRAVQAWGQLTMATELVERGGDLHRAYRIVRSIDMPAREEADYSLSKERLTLLGHLCLEIGRIEEARESYEETIDLARERDDHYLAANALYNLATLSYEELRETPTEDLRTETEELARAAIEAAAVADHPTVPILSTWILGMVTPGPEGRRHLEGCYRSAGRDDLRSFCLNPLATRIAPTDPERALRILSESRALAEGSRDARAELRVWQETIRVSWLAEPPERALDQSWRALDAIETLRDRQEEGSEIQAGVFASWSDDYAWLAGRLLEEASRGRGGERAISEAFRVGERMRARALTDWLGRAADVSGTAPSSAFASLADVRRAMGADEAMLSFVVAPWEDQVGDFAGGAWLTVATRDRVRLYRLPGRVELRHGARSFSGLVGRRDGAEIRTSLRLYDDLLAEALAGLPDSVDRLILVPDDALHRLPFAALRASEDAEPLGARFELVQVPSATLWLRWRNAPPAPAPEPLLVLADPKPPGAAGGEAGTALTLAAVRGGAGERSAAEVFEELPHARREGEAARRALGGGLLLVGAKASEAAVRRLPLRDFWVLHVAAHAWNDEARPERSMVVLAAEKAADGADRADGADVASDRDGYLRAAEIARLDLRGRLVALAVCESAGGSTLRGEGVMSLARAFFQAGAHTVVASLWRLRDDDSAAMFDRFYRHLGRGESAAAALRAARREAIAAGEPAAAWAGLVVLGDGSLVPVPDGRRGFGDLLRAPVTLALVAAVLAVAGFAALRRRRTRRG